MAEGVASGVAKPGTAPPGWTGRLFAALERLPGPTWLAYVLGAAAWIALGHAAPWLARDLPIGSFNEQLAFTPPWALYCVALVHALDRTARSAFGAFRPAIGVGEDEAGRLSGELTRVPGRAAAVSSFALGVLVFGSYASDPAGQSFAAFPASIQLVSTVNEVVTVIVLGILVLHTIRQLRLVGRLHERVTRIDLFAPAPLYAFSRLTSWTGIGLVGLAVLTLILFPITATLAIGLPFMGAIVALAVACFVLPLAGMQRRIAAEKDRLLAEVGTRQVAVIGWIHRDVDAEDLSRAAQLKDTLEGLRAEREIIGRLSTLPFSVGTLRGFATAVLLPIGLWAATRVLEQVFP